MTTDRPGLPGPTDPTVTIGYCSHCRMNMVRSARGWVGVDDEGYPSTTCPDGTGHEVAA